MFAAVNYTLHSRQKHLLLICSTCPHSPTTSTNFFLKQIHNLKIILERSSYQHQKDIAPKTKICSLHILNRIIKYPFIQVHFSHSYIEYSLIYKNIRT